MKVVENSYVSIVPILQKLFFNKKKTFYFNWLVPKKDIVNVSIYIITYLDEKNNWGQLHLAEFV